MTNEFETFSVGKVLASPQHNIIELGGRKIKLQPKVMEVLVYLAEHRDRVIANDELLDQVWGGRIVTHSSIQKSINALRSALAELDAQQEYIVHYSKRGYQLAGDLLENLEPSSDPNHSKVFQSKSRLKTWLPLALASLVCVLLVFAVLLMKQNDQQERLPSQPKIYAQATPLLSEEGSNGLPEPDWVNNRLAFVRTSEQGGDFASSLIVRHASGAQWVLSTAKGEFIDLAWSPSGRNLLVLEIQSNEGHSRSADFYGEANNYYSIHVFTLDFKGERLIEKNSLSHWQGKINSITWWDENTLELVASQGTSRSADRYRYAVGEQQLSKLSLAKSGTEPLLSKVMHQQTAVLSRVERQLQLEFYSANNRVEGRWPVRQNYIDMSWLPDGSGVLLLGEDGTAVVFHADGSQIPVLLPSALVGQYTRLRATQGDRTLLCSVRRPQVDAEWLKPSGLAEESLREDNAELRAAQFAAADDAWVYALERTASFELWRQVKNEKQLLLNGPVRFENRPRGWSQTREYFYWQSLNQVNQLSLSNQKVLPLFESSAVVEVLKVDDPKRQIWVVTDEDEARNIWLIEAEKRKQLTYGNLGTAKAGAEGIFFQYAGQTGTWLLDTERYTIGQIDKVLPVHSRILAVNSEGIYYVTGGECRESDVQFLNLVTGVSEIALPRTTSKLNTVVYDPELGAIQSNCVAQVSNIFELHR